MSFYECLQAFPEGSDSASRLALTAKRFGYKGIIICNLMPDRIWGLQPALSMKGIDVVLGVEVAADNARSLKSRVSSLRRRYPFLVVNAGSEEMIRAACEDPQMDVVYMSGRLILGIAAARSAKLNQVAIGFDLSHLIRLRGSARARWLEATARNLELARKFSLNLVITAGARSRLDLRAPRDLLALAEVAGFGPDEAATALELPGKLVRLNAGHWVSPGVELL
jgi:ribonuclease P/MRP protein subunit RPP1